MSTRVLRGVGARVDMIRVIDHTTRAVGPLPHRFTIPPQVDAYRVAESGPGPSYLDDESGAQNHWTTRNTVFAAWNMLHTARRLKDHGGVPAHGNVTTNWDLGNPTHPNPEYR